MFRENEENSLAEQIEERKEKIAMYIPVSYTHLWQWAYHLQLFA